MPLCTSAEVGLSQSLIRTALVVHHTHRSTSAYLEAKAAENRTLDEMPCEAAVLRWMQVGVEISIVHIKSS